MKAFIQEFMKKSLVNNPRNILMFTGGKDGSSRLEHKYRGGYGGNSRVKKRRGCFVYDVRGVVRRRRVACRLRCFRLEFRRDEHIGSDLAIHSIEAYPEEAVSGGGKQ